MGTNGLYPCAQKQRFLVVLERGGHHRYRSDQLNMGSKDLGLVTFYSNRLYYAASRLRFSLRSN